MSELNYQRREEAARELTKQERLRWLGPSYRDVWRVLAEEIGARHEGGAWWRSPRVVADVGPWEVVLDVFTCGKVTFTRLRAPYVNADGFRFTVFRKHFLSGLAGWLGFQDVVIGCPEFDDPFVIRGNDAEKLRRLFGNPRLRELLLAQKDVAFRVLDDHEHLFRKRFPDGVDQLQFLACGIVKDLDRLKMMYDLFAETLSTLCRIGSAHEDDPRVTL